MFSKKLPADEQAKAWKAGIREQKRNVQRQMRHIEWEENRVKATVATLIRQHQTENAMPMVQSIAASRKARSQLLKVCTQFDSLIRQIDLQLAQLKITGAFAASAEITHMMNQLLRLEDVQATAQQMNAEMMRAGIIAGMADETLESALEQDAPEDQELAVRLVYNEIARQVNRTGARRVPVIPIDPTEIAANPQAAALVN
jgi:hypothetical protein